MAEERVKQTGSAKSSTASNADVVHLSEGKAVGVRPLVVMSAEAAPGLPNVPASPSASAAPAATSNGAPAPSQSSAPSVAPSNDS